MNCATGGGMRHMPGGVSLVLGGAASGKSRFAEQLVRASGGEKVYLATAQGRDDEMCAKIAHHRAARGTDWRTQECPLQVGHAIAALGAGQIMLLDCASMWLANHQLAGSDIHAETAALLRALQHCRGSVVVVSNEVGASVVPDNAVARAFRNHQGRLNQQLAASSQRVVLVVAGLPWVLRGHLP